MAQKLDRLIARDVALCEAMSDEFKAYLKSNELFWEPDRRRAGGADLPKLTLGGLLLARAPDARAGAGAGPRRARVGFSQVALAHALPDQADARPA